MVNYSCSNCLKDFTQKSHYTTHLNKKIPCINNIDKLKESFKNIINESIDNKLNDIITNKKIEFNYVNSIIDDNIKKDMNKNKVIAIKEVLYDETKILSKEKIIDINNKITPVKEEKTDINNTKINSKKKIISTKEEKTDINAKITSVKEEKTDINNKTTSLKNKKIKFIDLFCGIGSFHYSFKKLDWECVMACDINNAVKQTYYENYGVLPLDDITKIEPLHIAGYDILCAGFPCQPFSQCGKHKGFDDDRGTLFFNIMKFVKFHKPPIIILENVQGLLNHNNGKTIEKIKSDIQNEDYKVVYKIIKCSD